MYPTAGLAGRSYVNFCLTLSVEFVRLISLPHSVSEPLDLNDFIVNPTHCFSDIFLKFRLV